MKKLYSIWSYLSEIFEPTKVYGIWFKIFLINKIGRSISYITGVENDKSET